MGKDKMRAAISLVSILAIAAGFFMGKVSTDAFIGITAITITWWYKSKDDADKSSRP